MLHYSLFYIGSIIALLSRSCQSVQTITFCDDLGNATCLLERRICLRYTTALEENSTVDEVNFTVKNQTCGNCIAGHVNFSGRNCTLIDELSWEAFLDIYKPSHLASANISLFDEIRIFYDTLYRISQWNSHIPPHPYELGVNKFSADTEIERSRRHGFSMVSRNESVLNFSQFDLPNDRVLSNLPRSVNWVQRGMVTDVRDQAQCGCCWAIAAVEAIEGVTAIQNPGFLEQLSIQQLISCDPYDMGCRGGNVASALAYVWKNSLGGVMSSQAYPFVDQAGITTACSLGGKNISVAIDNPTIVVTYDRYEENMFYKASNDDYPYQYSQRLARVKAAVAQQPVAVTIHSDCDLLLNYQSGILTDDTGCECSVTECMDHSVLLVGYNDNSNPPYWYIKNSWGPDWGENGYFRVSQEDSGTPWGLFGLLGEAIYVKKAVNTTLPLPRTSSGTFLENMFSSSSIQSLLILAAVVLFLLGVILVVIQICVKGCAKR